MTTAVGSIGNLEHIPEREASYREAVKILLRHGAVFPQADPKVQALLAAAAQDDLPGVKNAVQQGTSVNSADAGGWTALTISLALGYRNVTDWLIQQGADSKTHTQQGYSPLLFAANRQDAGLVEQFIANGAKPDPGDHSGLDEAISNKNQRIFDDLVRAGANAGAIDLSSCIQNGQVAMAKTLLDAGANPDPPHPMENRNTVYWAVYYNQPEILKLLLAHGANPNLKDDYGDTPLSSAQQFHHDLVPILEAALKGTGK
jgi:ankyrin repeat protein